MPDMNDESYIWDCYNTLLLCPDVDRIRKLIVRYELFKQSLDVPGDIVECGVFRGVGLMYWLKLLEIFSPASTKRVIGLDTFGSFDRSTLKPYELATVEMYENEAGLDGLSRDEVWNHVKNAGWEYRAELVVGDLQKTASAYVAAHPGFRISLLNLDADTYVATRSALEAFWPVVSRGGVVILDEYGVRGWGESDAVDEFFAQESIQLKTVPFSTKPTAWIIKP